MAGAEAAVEFDSKVLEGSDAEVEAGSGLKNCHLVLKKMWDLVLKKKWDLVLKKCDLMLKQY